MDISSVTNRRHAHGQQLSCHSCLVLSYEQKLPYIQYKPVKRVQIMGTVGFHSLQISTTQVFSITRDVMPLFVCRVHENGQELTNSKQDYNTRRSLRSCLISLDGITKIKKITVLCFQAKIWDLWKHRIPLKLQPEKPTSKPYKSHKIIKFLKIHKTCM